VSRTLLVGDVHGCLDELEALLDACEFVAGDDRLVFVGDLVAKGPDSAGVVAIAMKHGARSVMGNHDHAVVALRDPVARAQGRATHREVVESLPPDALDWLAALPGTLALPEYEALVVHAGFRPDVPPETQALSALMNTRTLEADGSPAKSPLAGPLWASRWRGPRFVYFGHFAGAGLQRHTHALGLDTGCVYGGRLTACILPEQRLVSVPAARMHQEPGGPPRIYLGPVDGLGAAPVSVLLAAELDGRPRQALVLRDASGLPRAYLNRCRHLPIPIDGGSGRYLSDDGRHLLCGTHGAHYRLDDGMCVEGPCEGKALTPIALEVAHGLAWLIDERPQS